MLAQDIGKHRTKSNRTLNHEKSDKIIEAEKPLSQSLLWKLQADFYAKQGPDAWIKGIVPQYITTNPYIADLYAKIVFGYCRDIVSCMDYDRNSTIYILELAAGVGRFTYTFLVRFLHLLEQSSLKDLKIKYIISDLAERNASYWQSHSKLRPFFEGGILDCAVFDMSADEELRLYYSKEILRPGQLSNPLILFANYTFDSLPIDTFQVSQGKLYEGLLTLTDKNEAVDPRMSSILDGLDYYYTDRLLSDCNYYEETYLNDIIKYYRDNLEDSAFSLPNIAIRCIHRLIKLFGDDLVLISTDKGYRNLSSLQGIHHPYLSSHGSISLTVNFHALELFIQSLGGKAIHSIYEHENVTLSVFISSKRSHGFIETTLACNEITQGIGPDDFYRMK